MGGYAIADNAKHSAVTHASHTSQTSHKSSQRLSDTASMWFTQSRHNPRHVKLHVELFLSTTCPHCRAADQFFHHLESKTPWISVHRYYINTDTQALERLNQLDAAQKITINPFAVPAIFFCNIRWLGFDSKANTGEVLLKKLQYCRHQISKTGQLSPTTVKSLSEWSEAHWYEEHIDGTPSWLPLVASLAAMDALMPCSLWAVWVILSFLLLMQPGRARLLAGGVCLIVIGLCHALQQVNSALFYHLLFAAKWPMVLVGLACLAAGFRWYQTALPLDAARGRVQNTVLCLLALFLVLGVYSYSHDCVPNVALVFQEHVAKQNISFALQLFYTGLYQLVYLVLLVILLGAAVFGCARKTHRQTLIQKLAGIILLVAALYLIIYPILLL